MQDSCLNDGITVLCSMCEQTISLIGRTSRSYLSRGPKQSTILDFMDTTFCALSNLSQISKLRHTSRSILCYHISIWHGNAMLQKGENKHSSRCQWETKYTWRHSTFADYIKVWVFWVQWAILLSQDGKMWKETLTFTLCSSTSVIELE